MSYLGVWLDSENYSDVEYLFGTNIDVLKEDMNKEPLKRGYKNIKWEGDDGFSQHEEGVMWIVASIFEIKDLRHLMIHWHAYNGVDFDIEESNNLSELYKIKEMQTRKFRNADIIKDDLDMTIIDKGDEFECWKII